MNRPVSPFDIKSATVTGLALVLRTTDMAVIAPELATRVQDAGDLFTYAPVLIDVSALDADGEGEMLALGPLVELLASHDMRAVGIVGASGELLEQAHALGLVEELDIRPRGRRPQQQQPAPDDDTPAEATATTVAEDGIAASGVAETPQGHATVPQDLFAGLQDTASPETPTAAMERQPVPEAVQPANERPVVATMAATMVLDRPLRSGQRVYARGGDLVVLGVVSHGAEVIADGNIHVYGPLRGRAIAGASGDAGARIFAAAMEPELISIAGTYRTTDKPLADTVLGKPAQARLDGDRMLIEPLKN